MTSQSLRRGLPRTPGGHPWPPGDATFPRVVAHSESSTMSEPSVSVETNTESALAETSSVGVVASVPAPQSHVRAGTRAAVTGLRRGLPRVAGGGPWPDSGLSSPVIVEASTNSGNQAVSPVASASVPLAITTDLPETRSEMPVAKVNPEAAPVEGLRRGLPRTPGGEPWPSHAISVSSPQGLKPDSLNTVSQVEAPPLVAALVPEPASTHEPIRANEPQTVELASVAPAPRAKVGWVQRIKNLPLLSKIFLGSAAALVVAGAVIIAARLIIGIPAVASFIVTYPGASELPPNAPTGIPPWLGWQHFFNVFLMVLIIRTGITIRREQRPGAYWAPRRNPAAKVSLTVWLHQTMDILWLANGVIFVVLLFVTGQWMKIVPTSWDVIPNAISAGLQYATLNWPTENGWVNFNSLQVLAYFTIVFLAAPLAALTGYRMSGMWPSKARKLNALYPMEWARAIHFPVMIFFCAFIAVHVFLVFTTGALRNLNHIYASQDVVDWTGFWIFTASLVVMAGVWFAVRPLVIAPIARLFGPVTSR